MLLKSYHRSLLLLFSTCHFAFISEYMGGATSFKPCMLISSPSPPPPSHPLPYPHPSLHSLPLFPSRVEGSQSHLPLPSLSLPFPLPLPPGVPPLNQLGGLGERYKFPQWGLGQSPSRQTIWCISRPKGAALLSTVFVHFIRINVIFCDFGAEGSIKFSLP